MKFRLHRGGLDESMATCVEIDRSKAALAAVIARDMAVAFEGPRTVTAEDVSLEYYGFDERINWKTWVVLVRGFGVVGFTDSQVTR